MNRQKQTLILVLVSLLMAITLGMMDYETESLLHLFTGDPGNWIALLLYTGAFTLLGMIILGIIRKVKTSIK